MLISLLHATRRPEAAKKCQQLWLDRADNRANIEIITCADLADTATIEAFPDSVASIGEGACAAWNEAAKHAKGDVLVVLDDDWICPHGWDELIASHMSNGADILHVGDERRKDQLICHPIVSRRFYDAIGYVFHPLFKSVYCDNHFTTLAKSWGYVDATDGGKIDLGFLHANPSQGFGVEDEVARISNSKERYTHGGAVMERLTSNNFVLAFTACDRPHFLSESLASWEKTNLSLVTSVQFFIEPTDKLDAIHSVIDIFEQHCPVPVIRHVNPEKYGVLKNPWKLFENLFDKQLAKFVILGEDDFIVSPDALDFFEAMRGFSQPKTMAICLKNVGNESDKDPSKFIYTSHFDGNIWGLDAESWHKYLKDTWDFDYSSGKADDTPSGWDWNIGSRIMPRNELRCIVPTASRSFHIGTTGVHCTEEDYQNTTTYNFVREKFEGKYCQKGFLREKVAIVAPPMPEPVEITHTYSTTGDAGDAFVSLATIQHIGGKTTLYLRDGGGASGIVGRAHLIAPLIESQPYIKAVKIWKDEPIEWASEGFRGGWVDRITNLAGCHAKHALDTGFLSSLPDLSQPWLTVDADSKYAGRVIVNRSTRYNNGFFPWLKVVAHYGKRIVFIGMPDEHRLFCNAFGEVEYKQTKDFLEVARMIAGSVLFIGNQSACMTIAEGLKHPRILEGSLVIPDCIYEKSGNAQYVFDGSMTLPDIDGSGELKTPQQAFKLEEFELNMVPKHKKGWGWFYQHEDVEFCESMCKNTAAKLARKTGKTLAECKELVIRYNVNMSPAFFGRYLNLNHFQQCKNALLAAGYPNNSVFGLGTGNALGTI